MDAVPYMEIRFTLCKKGERKSKSKKVMEEDG